MKPRALWAAYSGYSLRGHDTDYDGVDLTVVGGYGIADDVIAGRPKRCDQIGLRFDGPQPRRSGGGTWDKVTVAFADDGQAEPDWDRMAKSRAARKTQRADDEPYDAPLPPQPDDDQPGF